ncbi:MAG: shikimate dehydrogenase [Alphaproteobacteria bacterium]
MSITGKAKISGIMGWPVKHSRSPLIHGHWLDRYNIDGAYIPYAVKPEDGTDAFRSLARFGFAGTNVTIPHKITAFETVDRRNAAADAIGAVNTVVVEEDGSLSGSNTDALGFLEHLRTSAPNWVPTAASAAVIGAGGSTRAALFALLSSGVPEIWLTNRTRAKADQLADFFGDKVKVIDWDKRSEMLAGVGLVVNTTSLGMVGQPPLDIALNDLPKSAVVYDIVYVPLETALLAAARMRGNLTVDGLGMLLHQAAPGFAAWFGVEPKVDAVLRDVILADLA